MIEHLDISFPYSSKADWMDAIRKSLKGKSPEELGDELENGLHFSPFQHLEDTGSYTKLPIRQKRRSLHIEEDLCRTPQNNIHKEVLEALRYGAEVLCLPLTITSSIQYLKQTLEAVRLTLIQLAFSNDEEVVSGAQLSNLLSFYKTNEVPNGTDFYLSPSDFSLLSTHHEELIRQLDTNYVNRWVQFHTRLNEPVKELSKCLNSILEFLECRIYEPKELLSRVTIRLQAGENFLLNIASIRALKILLANIAEDLFDEVESNVLLEGYIRQPVLKGEMRLAYIPATYKAMSLISGGVDRISVNAAVQTKESTRIMRNITHLLLMESAYDEVMDPAAGSYYIEELTIKIVSQVWELLIRKS